ncbi:MAG: hypothetical protein GX174_08885 [Lentisphaerae bacterium]|nr:hypothetical protein [Lentisphaerota bacterium]
MPTNSGNYGAVAMTSEKETEQKPKEETAAVNQDGAGKAGTASAGEKKAGEAGTVSAEEKKTGAADTASADEKKVGEADTASADEKKAAREPVGLFRRIAALFGLKGGSQKTDEYVVLPLGGSAPPIRRGLAGLFLHARKQCVNQVSFRLNEDNTEFLLDGNAFQKTQASAFARIVSELLRVARIKIRGDQTVLEKTELRVQIVDNKEIWQMSSSDIGKELVLERAEPLEPPKEKPAEPSKDTPRAAPKAPPKVAPKGLPKKSPKGLPKGALKKSPAVSPGKTSGESSADSSKDSAKDTPAEPPKDTPAEPPKDTPAEPPKDTPAEPPKDSAKDSPADSAKEAPAESAKDASKETPAK